MPDTSAQRHLVLASTSTYRATALRQLQLDFETVAPAVDETPLAGEEPGAMALRLACRKAEAVAANFTDAVIVGSDQVGLCAGRVLTKPGTAENAVAQLCVASGQTARFFTAVAVHDQREGLTRSELITTELTFRDLTEAEVRRYVALDNPIDCAGSFKVESLGIALFTAVVATDPSALVGLPLIALVSMLQECGLSPLQPV